MNVSALPKGPFDVILADPPWRYGSPRAMVGTGGRGVLPGVENIVQVDVEGKYPTMTLAEICAIPVPSVCADNALLFLWVTNPFLADCAGARVVYEWGFKPVGVHTWAKAKEDGTPSMKTGHWFRSASEHVIFATRGKVARPKDWEAIPTWFSTQRLPHSVKPDRFHRIAEQAIPGGRYLEMFARRAYPGWAVWGNEAPVVRKRVRVTT